MTTASKPKSSPAAKAASAPKPTSAPKAVSAPAETKPAASKPVASVKPVEAAAGPAVVVEDAVKATEEAVNVGKASVERIVKVGSEAAVKNYDKAVTLTREQTTIAMKAGDEAVAKYEESLSVGKEAIEALIESGNIFGKGVQELSDLALAMSKSMIDESVSATKSLMEVKSPEELLALQIDLSKAGFTKAINDVNALSEAYVKLCNEALAPITARIEASVQKAFKSAA